MPCQIARGMECTPTSLTNTIKAFANLSGTLHHVKALADQFAITEQYSTCRAAAWMSLAMQDAQPQEDSVQRTPGDRARTS